MQESDFFKVGLGFLEQAGVLYSRGDLTCQSLQDRQVPLVKSSHTVALHIQHTNDLPLGFQGHSKLRPNLLQAWQSHVTCTYTPYLGSKFDTSFIADQAFAPNPHVQAASA